MKSDQLLKPKTKALSTRLKQAIAASVTFAMIATSINTTAYGMSLSGAFNNLLTAAGGTASYNAPGNFQSGARNTMSGGGFDVRFNAKSTNMSLFSVTPPSFSATCSGINATFGGFSMISGKDIETIITKLGTGAIVGFIATMVVKVTCPMCEEIISKLRATAQLASRLASDACNAGMALGAMLADKLVPPAKPGDAKSGGICASKGSDVNKDEDFLSMLNNACGTALGAINSSLDSVNTSLKNLGVDPKSPSGLSAMQKKMCEMGSGNKLWLAMIGFDKFSSPTLGATSSTGVYHSYGRKVLLQSIIGAELGKMTTSPTAQQDATGAISTAPPGSAACIKANGDVTELGPDSEDSSIFCTPTLNKKDAAEKIADLFMCGTVNDSSLPTEIQTYCASAWKSSSTSSSAGLPDADNLVLGCEDGPTPSKPVDSPYCHRVKQIPFKDAFLKDDPVTKGLISQVYSLLSYGIERVTNNEPFAKDPAMGSELLGLINSAPYPLYQVINVAAVYPSSATSMVKSMSILIAQSMAGSALDDFVTITAGNGGDGNSCLTAGQSSKLLEIAEQIRVYNSELQVKFANRIVNQETIINQIKTINIAIQKQVLSQDLLSSAKFAESVTQAAGK